MQNPTDQADTEASIATDTASVNSGPKWNRAVAVRRKVAKRSHPFDLAAEELHLMSSLPPQPPPQAEDIPAPARKKPRLEESLPTTADEAAKKTASPDISGAPPPPPPPAVEDGDDDDDDDADDDADADADADPVSVSVQLL
jgi:hypothetical protein